MAPVRPRHRSPFESAPAGPELPAVPAGRVAGVDPGADEAPPARRPSVDADRRSARRFEHRGRLVAEAPPAPAALVAPDHRAGFPGLRRVEADPAVGRGLAVAPLPAMSRSEGEASDQLASVSTVPDTAPPPTPTATPTGLPILAAAKGAPRWRPDADAEQRRAAPRRSDPLLAVAPVIPSPSWATAVVEPAEPTPSETVVQVTIGRVEIRTSGGSSRSRRPDPAADQGEPKRLEAYLDERARRRAR